MSADGLTIYFTTFRDVGKGRGSEIYRAERPRRDAPFGQPTSVPELNTTNNETFSMSADDLTGILVTDRPGSLGENDIWIADRTSTLAPWTFSPAVGTTAQEWDGRSRDGLHLYFTTEGLVSGKQVIAVVSRPKRPGPFGSDYRPLAGIDDNHQSDNADPTLSPDRRVLVFCSNRPGQGGADLWYAVRIGNADSFSAPQPLPGLNTSRNDQDPFISADGTELYFSSDRPPAVPGGNDVYRVIIHAGP